MPATLLKVRSNKALALIEALMTNSTLTSLNKIK